MGAWWGAWGGCARTFLRLSVGGVALQLDGREHVVLEAREDLVHVELSLAARLAADANVGGVRNVLLFGRHLVRVGVAAGLGQRVQDNRRDAVLRGKEGNLVVLEHVAQVGAQRCPRRVVLLLRRHRL
jgi:hypothetical protein